MGKQKSPQYTVGSKYTCKRFAPSFLIRTLPSVREFHPVGFRNYRNFADYNCRYGIAPNPKDFYIIFLLHGIPCEILYQISIIAYSSYVFLRDKGCSFDRSNRNLLRACQKTTLSTKKSLIQPDAI